MNCGTSPAAAGPVADVWQKLLLAPAVVRPQDLSVAITPEIADLLERLARHMGWELMVVRRRAGDMLARWQGRWAGNLLRYRELSTARLILPWSTPSMRFCTSELKTDVICSALKKRFPDRDIINATGIRRQESASRARMPIAGGIAKLQRRGFAGVAESHHRVVD